MRATSKLLALALTAALQPAMAGVVSLNFEDPSAVGQLANQYAKDGVTFTGSAWDVSSALNGCNGSWLFSKVGSCGALLLGDPGKGATTDKLSFTINVTGGFVDAFDFVYGLRGGSDVTITVFDALGGIDGTGTALARLSGLTGSTCGDSDLRFCQWYNGSVDFTGTAYSITISGVDKRLMLDDLKFTTAAPGSTVPEPASIALALGALGALGWSRKRAAR